MMWSQYALLHNFREINSCTFFLLPLTLFSSDQNVSSQTCYLHANYTGVEDTHSETVTFTRDYLSWYHSITKDSGVIWRTHEVLHFLRQVPKCAVKLHIKISHFTLGQTLQWGWILCSVFWEQQSLLNGNSWEQQEQMTLFPTVQVCFWLQIEAIKRTAQPCQTRSSTCGAMFIQKCSEAVACNNTDHSNGQFLLWKHLYFSCQAGHELL